jgi:hypothetical protein
VIGVHRPLLCPDPRRTQFRDRNRNHHSHSRKNCSRIRQELRKQNHKNENLVLWKWNLGVTGHGVTGPEVGTGIWDPEKQNCNNGTKVIAYCEMGPGIGNRNRTRTSNRTRVVGLEIGTRTWDPSVMGPKPSRDWSHRIGVTETETEAKLWKQVIGNM